MTILAAVDGEPGSTAVARHGQDLASAFGEELTILHVLPDTENRDDAEAVARDVAGETFENTEEVVTVGRLGTPEARILRQADEIDARYVVLGSRKQSPAGKAMFGSTAQIVLLNTERPVVIVSGNQ